MQLKFLIFAQSFATQSLDAYLIWQLFWVMGRHKNWLHLSTHENWLPLGQFNWWWLFLSLGWQKNYKLTHQEWFLERSLLITNNSFLYPYNSVTKLVCHECPPNTCYKGQPKVIIYIIILTRSFICILLATSFYIIYTAAITWTCHL